MTNAARVAEIGIQLYGDAWCAPVAILTGVRRRTVQRIRVSAIEGEENDAAHGVLAAVMERLREIVLRQDGGYGGATRLQP